MSPLLRRIVALGCAGIAFLGALGFATAQPFMPALAPRTVGSAGPRAQDDKLPWFGGLGFASVGPFFGSSSGLASALDDPAALGANYVVPHAGLFIGGGGGAVLFRHIWVGGKGFALLTKAQRTSKGESSLGGGGGGFELGYVVHPAKGWLLVPFLGLTDFAYSLDVRNKSAAPLTVTTDIAIKPGATESFSAKVTAIEGGIRIQRLLFFGGTGGLTAGFEAGFLASLGSEPWTHGEKALDNKESAYLSGGYIRFNVGGGGFILR